MRCPPFHTAKGSKCRSGGRSLFFSSKLFMNDSGGYREEQEAEAVAENVLRMPETRSMSPSFFKPVISPIQLKEAYRDDNMQNLGKTLLNTDAPAPLADDYLNSLSGGRALSETDQHVYGSAMGYDFSDVKLHTDHIANHYATALNALAFTTGHHIVFRSGQYQPDTVAGKRLLVHELSHVVQQKSKASPTIQRQPDQDHKESKSDISRALNENSLFKKLPDFAREKIIKEIDNTAHSWIYGGLSCQRHLYHWAWGQARYRPT